MVFVNKMDIVGADFFHVVDMIKDRLKNESVAIQIPIGKEDTFTGIIDLMRMKAEVYLSEDEKKMCRELNENGVYVYIQKLPQDSQVDVMTKI